MNSLVTICIPTYCRPELLRLALQSCFVQKYRPLEIVISDDSPDQESERLIESLPNVDGLSVVYRHNVCALGQNANVNQLFDLASGTRLVLLHDDDLLKPFAIESLAMCWREHPDLLIAYGKQAIIANDGTGLPTETESRAKEYFRTPERSGLQSSVLEAALMQQIPSDGYMIDASVAKRIKYRSAEQTGVYGDTDFTIRLGISETLRPAFFLNEWISDYRYSFDAITNSSKAKRVEGPRAGIALYGFVESLVIAAKFEPARTRMLQRISIPAVKGLALSGRRSDANSIYFSEYYPLWRRLTPRGLYHMLLIVLPVADKLRRYQSDSLHQKP